jgi:hypothetical protein
MNITLTNYLNNKVSEKEVFDFVFNKIIEQGKPSVIRRIVDGIASAPCAYRGDNGCKCAFGHIITDEELNVIQTHWFRTIDINTLPAPHIMQIAMAHLKDKEIDPLNLETNYKNNFILSLQRAHDVAAYNPNFIDAYKSNMEGVKVAYRVLRS